MQILNYLLSTQILFLTCLTLIYLWQKFKPISARKMLSLSRILILLSFTLPLLLPLLPNNNFKLTTAHVWSGKIKSTTQRQKVIVENLVINLNGGSSSPILLENLDLLLMSILMSASLRKKKLLPP